TPAEERLDLDRVGAPIVFYEGTAREAALAFPQNANVVAAVALAGVGFERTHVRLMVDPGEPRNCHVVRARGAFGELETRVVAHTLPAHPKTSTHAADPTSASRLARRRSHSGSAVPGMRAHPRRCGRAHRFAGLEDVFADQRALAGAGLREEIAAEQRLRRLVEQVAAFPAVGKMRRRLPAQAVAPEVERFVLCQADRRDVDHVA